MAEIFLATQHGAEGFEKHVVLKRILTQFSADPQFGNMLLDEGHISMTLQHSNIVQVLDLGVAGSRYFLVLELVDGWDLERILVRAHGAGMVFPPALSLYVIRSCPGAGCLPRQGRAGSRWGSSTATSAPTTSSSASRARSSWPTSASRGAAQARQTAAGVIKSRSRTCARAGDRHGHRPAVGHLLRQVAAVPHDDRQAAVRGAERSRAAAEGQRRRSNRPARSAWAAVSAIVMKAAPGAQRRWGGRRDAG